MRVRVAGTLSVLLLVGVMLESGCAPLEGGRSGGVFSFDQEGIPGPKPWTSQNFRNDQESFQFAIIGDRTGGANAEGTFALAMDQLNLLQPEFVINVGDIIEGYTRDKADLHSQWEEAEGLTRILDMPFFLTRGNHDASYPEAKEVWSERHGPAYYHFLYRNVLFMVLDTEDAPRLDPPPGMEEQIKLYNRLQTEDPERAKRMLDDFMKDEAIVAGLSKPVEFPQGQMDWIEETLEANAGVRWTFVFTHEPCWENPSESFKAVQALLESRQFTWFAGHLHYYDYDLIDGHEYITMGPAGASWHHDGPGNVDHIMKIHSLNPQSMLDHENLYRTLMYGKGPLKRPQREMIGVVVSALNHCVY